MSLIDYDFIEIGTSDFNTLLQTSKNEFGISIEPVKHQLDNLPKKPNVKKINCAISLDNTNKKSKIFYLEDNVIQKYNLPKWIRGCNSLNGFHLKHREYKVEKFVSIDEIDEIPIAQLLIENNVRKIKFLKLDTEGGDCYILNHLKKYLESKSFDYYPTEILFETNLEINDINLVNKTLKEYKSIGYKIKQKRPNDILLTRLDNNLI